MAEEEDFSQLSTEDKVTHKSWRARVLGYEEAMKLFRRIDDEKSPEFGPYLNLLKKFVTDSNVVAQEKALEATLSLVGYAAAAPKVCGEVVPGLVAKAFNGRPKTKQLAFDICLTFIEMEKQDVVQEEVHAGLSNKQPKIVVACLELFTAALKEFGAKVMDVKKLMKTVPAQLEHKDKNVREAAKGLAVEMYRWLGPALKISLEGSLKPVQMKEIEEECGKLPSTVAVPSRLLRSEQKKQALVSASAVGGGDNEDEGEEGEEVVGAVEVETIDPYDLLDPVDLLAQMPKDFYDNIGESKWSIRKEALESILPLASKPKLAQGDYNELAKTLVKLITKDSNVLVVALAANVVKGLATGLREGFQPLVHQVLPGMLGKFKEKKMGVVTALREATDAVYLTTSFSTMEEDIVAALADKNPSVKAETALFLARCFQQCTPALMPKPLLKSYCPPLIQCLHDVPAVREAAAEALGTALKVVGERGMAAYIDGLESIKMTKVNEVKDRVELQPPRGVHAKAARKRAEEEAAPVKKSAKPKKEVKEEKEDEGSAEPPPPKPKKKKVAKKSTKEEPKAASAAATESKPVSKPAAKKSGGASKPSGGGGKGKGKGGGGAGMGDAPDPPEAAIDDEEVAERAEALLPGSVRAGLGSSKWQERLEAHEGIKKMVEGMAAEEVQSLLLVKILGMKPGWKETMFQVMKAKIAVVAVVAGRAKVFGRKTVAAVLPTIVDKLGDVKIKAQSSETLMAVAERMTLNYTSLQTLKHAFGQKNPKVQSESLEWLGQAVREFGLLINIKPHVDYVNKAFESTNPAVRAAAVSLLGVMRMYVGAQLRMFFEDAKPALLQQIDAVFEKASDEAPPAPVRGPNCQTEEDEVEADDAEEGGAEGGAKAEEPQMSLADLMPKVDISPQITSSLVSELGDKNWKVRGEALQKVTDILAAAKFIEPSLGELPGALKGRLSDSNKNLITTTLNIMTTLANAMGSACGRHARTLLPGVFGALADAKPQLRAAAIATLNAWYDQIKLAPLVEAEIISTALATENPNLRSELLQWLAEKLPEAGKLPAEFPSIVPPLLSCLEDRSGEVRKHSQTVLPLVMARVGYEGMVRQTGKLKPASKQAILPLLEKHKASLPPPKSAKAKASSSAKEKTEAKEPSDSSSPAAAGKETKTGKAGKTASKTGSKKGTGKKGKEAEEDFGPPLMKGPAMQQRQKDEQNFKILKWSFSTPRSEFVEQLKDQMQPCVSRPLHAQLFHDDFKQHIAALGTLKECVSGSAPYEGEAIACLDLLLKWVTLRFCDTNTTVNLKCLEFLSSLFALLIKGRYRMSDFEAAAFLPFLVIKSGDAKDAVRKEVRALFDQICCFYAPPKLFGYVAEGLKSKNSRQRFECLEMLGVLVQNNGLVVCQPSPQKAVQQIAPFVGEKDSSVRNAALNTLVIFYENMGEAVYKHVGRLPHKDLSMLEERIRRVAKKSSPETNTTITLQAKQVSPNPLGEGEGEDPPPQQRGGAKGGASRRRLALDPDATVTKEPEPEAEPDPPAPPPAEPEPEVAPPSTASPPKRSAIPVPSGPMRIDFSKYVYPAPPVLKLPRLPDHNMEELLADFEVPQYETSRLLANPPPSLTFSPNRMATTSAAISFIVSQIASSDQQSCVSALKQMEQILSKTEHASTVRLHVDQLLRAVLMQMRMNFNTQLQQASSPENLKQVMAVGKRLTSCLLNTFSQPELASAASQDTLVETERDVMTLLQDERMLRLEDVAQLNRSFNYLMLKVIENGDKNALFGSLLHVMLESLGQDGNPSKLTEMVMKCLWKLTRQLAQILPQMSAEQLLLDVHHFFTGYIGLTAEGRVLDDTPFRTVKTILFHLVTIMGDSVLDHLTLVEDSRQSAMYKYLCKTIAKKRLSGEGVGPQIKNPTKEGGREGASRVQPKRPPQLVIVDIPDELATPLANALDKMRDRSFETMREGFRELYALIEKHPSFDFHAFVASNTLSPYQNYVKRGLKAVEYERQCIAENKKPLAETFQNMLYSDELRASKERYNVMKKELEMEGIVLGRSNPAETSKENPGAAPGTKLTKKVAKPGPKVENPLAAPRHSPPPPGSSSDEPDAQDMSKFNLGSLMQRLNKLKGTS